MVMVVSECMVFCKEIINFYEKNMLKKHDYFNPATACSKTIHVANIGLLWLTRKFADISSDKLMMACVESVRSEIFEKKLFLVGALGV